MEELRTAIKAMKKAKESLAEQGFMLKWNFKVKYNRGLMLNAIKRWITETDVSEKNSETRSVSKPKPASKRVTAPVQKHFPAQSDSTAPAESAPEKVKEETEEVRPVTAFEIKEAASYLGISYAGVYDLIRRGRLPAHGESGKRWFTTEELDQYLASRKKPRAE